MKLAKKLSNWQALVFISLSTLFISGPAWGAWLIYCKFFDIRASDPKYNTAAILQAYTDNESLQTSYLAELLDLSIDRPRNIYQINLKEEQEKLKSLPMIQNAIVKRIPPSTLYVDYAMRRPLCFIADLANTAIDCNCVLFPFKPFFSEKTLPQIFLGLNDRPSWGEKIEDQRLEIALDILKHLDNHFLEIERIDVSEAFADSLGKKQVVVVFREGIKKIYLRLPEKEYGNRIKMFYQLYKSIQGKSFANIVVDARIQNVFYLNK